MPKLCLVGFMCGIIFIGGCSSVGNTKKTKECSTLGDSNKTKISKVTSEHNRPENTKTPSAECLNNKKIISSTLNKLRNGEHVTIVALGDSITANTLYNYGRMNWVSLLDVALFEKYGFESCTLINAGVPGSTYAHSLKRLDRDVLRFKPDMVIIMLGMNDAGHGAAYLPKFKEEVHQTIERIRSECHSDILLMTPNPIVTDTGGKWFENMSPGKVLEVDKRPVGKYAKVIVEVAKETNCALIDNYTIWENTKYPAEQLYPGFKEYTYQYDLWPRMANSVHPGPLGHLAFYRELSKVFDTERHFAWE